LQTDVLLSLYIYPKATWSLELRYLSVIPLIQDAKSRSREAARAELCQFVLSALPGRSRTGGAVETFMLSTDSQMIPKMNSDYFVTNIVIPFEQVISPQGKAPYQKRLVAHLDNCSVHISRASTNWLEEQGMRHMPHSPYSPDLALVTSICFVQ
jgi:hypothetical protein